MIPTRRVVAVSRRRSIIPCCFLRNLRLRNRRRVPIVPLALGQDKQVLVRLGAAISHTLGHRVELVPDHVLPEKPPVSLEREGSAPGDADQVFGLEAGRLRRTSRAFDRCVSRLLAVF